MVAATKECPRTSSSAFVAASLQQLIAAARLPNSGICEIAVNASLAFIEGAKPRDEIECALVIQMACTHSAAMAVLNRLGGAAGDRTVAAMASAAARLLRAYATQVEALRRLPHGGFQTVLVEHVASASGLEKCGLSSNVYAKFSGGASIASFGDAWKEGSGLTVIGIPLRSFVHSSASPTIA